jgi:hypothetical protein
MDASLMSDGIRAQEGPRYSQDADALHVELDLRVLTHLQGQNSDVFSRFVNVSELLLRARGDFIEPWFMAPIGMNDHAYENCPALQRELLGQRNEWERRRKHFHSVKELHGNAEWLGEWDVEYPEVQTGWGVLDPDDEMCGWCRRVWVARNRKAVA